MDIEIELYKEEMMDVACHLSWSWLYCSHKKSSIPAKDIDKRSMYWAPGWLVLLGAQHCCVVLNVHNKITLNPLKVKHFSTDDSRDRLQLQTLSTLTENWHVRLRFPPPSTQRNEWVISQKDVPQTKLGTCGEWIAAPKLLWQHERGFSAFPSVQSLTGSLNQLGRISLSPNIFLKSLKMLAAFSLATDSWSWMVFRKYLPAGTL